MKDNLVSYDNNKKIIQKAVSHLKVLKSSDDYSYVELNPITGRKHQLRKQLLIRGYPILGDNKYKFDSVGKNKKSNLMLHSYKINFSINNIKYKYVAELTDIFKKTLNEKYLKNYQQ